MDEVIKIILKKKELANLDKELVKKVINNNLNTKIKKLIKEERFKNKDFKEFIKIVRSQLRRQYGAFQNPKMERMELVKKKDYLNLLKSHQSTKERLPYYKDFYNKLWKITGKPGSILDVGCGMNPVSFEYMNLGNNIEYLALDISKKDLEVISEYFRQKGINGSVKVFDAARDDYNFNKVFDACFCFKLFEILETTNSHRLTEDIILKLPAKQVIASFSTKTLSDAPMTKKRRVWFEVMLKRLGYSFETIELANELFYCFKKDF
ncbi:MAG: methyltransferase domain-containing protein [Nanoarchaeota archaeon]|nr:methyltransferase domain-containing protein [Nanoarchaeota archaeon]